MPGRNELVTRANVVGINPDSYPNDSKLEQKILYMEKNATAQTGVISTTTLTSTGTAVADGDTVTVGGKTYTAKTALTEAKANSTLTSNATTPSDGDFVSVAGQTYTFRTALTNTVGAPNEVLIGVSAAVALDNLKSAITADGTAVYGAGTVAHPTVTATTNTDTTQLVVAKNAGVAANAFRTAVTSVGTTLAWTGTTLTGGAEPVVNEVLIGSTADGAAFLTNLKAAMLGTTGAGTTYASTTSPNQYVIATTLGATTLVMNSRDFAIQNGAQATTKTSSQLSFTSTVMASGVSKVITPVTNTYAGSAGISGDYNHI